MNEDQKKILAEIGEILDTLHHIDGGKAHREAIEDIIEKIGALVEVTHELGRQSIADPY